MALGRLRRVGSPYCTRTQKMPPPTSPVLEVGAWGGAGCGRGKPMFLVPALSNRRSHCDEKSRRGLTPRGSLECNPEIPAFPGEEN